MGIAGVWVSPSRELLDHERVRERLAGHLRRSSERISSTRLEAPYAQCPFRCVLGPLSVSPPRAIARIGHVRLSKRGSVLVLFDFLTRLTIRRRTWMLPIRMNALTSASPSRVAIDLSTDRTKAAGRGGRRQRARPQRRTRSALAGYGKPAAAELELMRLVPFSYFWTCWNVMPRASPSPYCSCSTSYGAYAGDCQHACLWDWATFGGSSFLFTGARAQVDHRYSPLFGGPVCRVRW